MSIVLDLESTGVDPYQCKTIWCAVLRDVEEESEHIFTPDNLSDLPNFIKEHPTKYIMHNGISYDRVLLKRVLGINLPIDDVYDTLLLSRMLFPDIKVPDGWRGSPQPHSLAAWGMRFGIPKPIHEDWSQFSDDMLHRCREDAKINEILWLKLNKELKWKNDT